MTTKRCNKCQFVMSVTEFSKNKENRDGLNTICKICNAISAKQLTERGLKILQSLAENRGCCAHCQREYTNEDWHFFEFDHIDAKLKRSRRETESRWIIAHLDEFFTRVAPNLQLLCVKCHKIKTSQEMKVGGVVYHQTHNRSKPAEVIQRDLTLFDPAIILEPGEEYSLHMKEGEWITVRDIDGNLIRYELYSNYIKQ